MDIKTKLDRKTIYDKRFTKNVKGYDALEVDQFLDIIIDDYEQFLNMINTLEKEKADLLAEIMSLKQELRNSKLSMEVVKSNADNSDVTNVDIMRRLSQLEKMEYGLKSKNDEQ